MRPLTLIALCMLLAASARAAPASSIKTLPPPAERFGIEHAISLHSFSELTWSADGRRLAFVVTSPDTVESTQNQDICVADLERGETRRLTSHPKADISPTFSPSGDTLAFASYRIDEGKPTIMMMSFHGGEPWTIASFEESVGEVKWSPDGRTLAYVMNDSLPAATREWRRKKRDAVIEDERPQHPQLWTLDLATGARRKLTSDRQILWWVRWSPDSRRLAFLTTPSGRADDANLYDIGVVAAAGGAVRKLGVIGAEYAWSPDGRWIACATSIDRERFVDKTDVWIAPADGGAPIDLTAALDENAGLPAWNATSDTLSFHCAQGVTTVLATVALPRAGATPRVALAIDRRAEAGAPFGARSGRIAWVQSRPEEPEEIWVADHPRLPGRAVTALNDSVLDDSIAPLALGETRSVTWRSSDGVRVEGLLVSPPAPYRDGALDESTRRAPLPTLVMLHSGPYGRRNALGFQVLPQLLAAHGYQVFMPNFRSSGGYGMTFMLRRRGDWGGQDWRDVETGLDSLIRAGLADPARLGVFGRSYGGYLTTWAITQTTRFDAACVFAGAVDLASLWGASDVQQYRAWEFGGRPWETREAWARSSPMTHIAKVRTPTLIQTGENDARIPLAQALQLHRALRSLGVPTELVRYPREGHVLREPRHRADHMERMLAWFDRWVR